MAATRRARASLWLVLPLAAVLLLGGLFVALAVALGCESAPAGSGRGAFCAAAGRPLAWLAIAFAPATAVVAAGLAGTRRAALWAAGLALAFLLSVFVALAAVGA